MVQRGSDPCGCPSRSGVDPVVQAVAEAMARRDGFRFPASAWAMNNFLPLAEVAVSEVRRLAADPRPQPVASPVSGGQASNAPVLVLQLLKRSREDWTPICR